MQFKHYYRFSTVDSCVRVIQLAAQAHTPEGITKYLQIVEDRFPDWKPLDFLAVAGLVGVRYSISLTSHSWSIR